MGAGDCRPAARVARSTPGAVPPALVDLAVRLSVELGADGLRADLALCRAAGALAGLEGRRRASMDDIYRVARSRLDTAAGGLPSTRPGFRRRELDEAIGRATAAGGTGGGTSRRGSAPGGMSEGDGRVAPGNALGDGPGHEPPAGNKSGPASEPGAGGTSEPRHGPSGEEGGAGEAPGSGRGRREPAGRPGSRKMGEERRRKPSERSYRAQRRGERSGARRRRTVGQRPSNRPPAVSACGPPSSDGVGRGKARHPSAQAKESTRHGGRTIAAHPVAPHPSKLAVAPTALAAARRRSEGPGAAGIPPRTSTSPSSRSRPPPHRAVRRCFWLDGSRAADGSRQSYRPRAPHRCLPTS